MLGILCGLESEARIARLQPNAFVACSAARPVLARKLAKQLIEKGAKGLLSFGLAGALSPDLQPGSLVVGKAVESRGRTYLCDEVWSDALERACRADASGFIYGAEKSLDSPEAKEELFIRTGALVVDMESQAVAEAATAAHIPFTVLRVVVDDAMMTLPSAAQVPLLDDGRVDLQAVLKDLGRHPLQLLALIRLGAASGRAMRVLRRVSKLHFAEV